MIDRTPWDEADLKVKSLIYQSLGTEGCRTFHQRNPHTRIERCTTNELVHELALTFTRPRNLTFDRFQFFRALQRSNETLEKFYSRLRELGLHAKLDHLEEDLVKDLFISNMHSSNTQMELLSEVRTPQQVLNYAINRERGQANQQEICRAHSNWNTVTYVRPNKQQNLTKTQRAQKATPLQKMWQPFQSSTPPDLPGEKSTMQYFQKDRPLYIVMHIKDARTKNPSETTTYISRPIYVTPGKT